MELIIKQKIFSLLHSSFNVVDNNDELTYIVQPRVNILQIHDVINAKGVLEYVVKKRYLRIFNRFDICDANGKLLYILKRKYVPFIPIYKIKNFINSDLLKIKGDVMGWNFMVHKNNQPAIVYQKKIFAVTQTYAIETVEDKDAGLALAIAVALASARQKNRKFKIFR